MLGKTFGVVVSAVHEGAGLPVELADLEEPADV